MEIGLLNFQETALIPNSSGIQLRRGRTVPSTMNSWLMYSTILTLLFVCLTDYAFQQIRRRQLLRSHRWQPGKERPSVRQTFCSGTSPDIPCNWKSTTGVDLFDSWQELKLTTLHDTTASGPSTWDSSTQSKQPNSTAQRDISSFSAYAGATCYSYDQQVGYYGNSRLINNPWKMAKRTHFFLFYTFAQLNFT